MEEDIEFKMLCGLALKGILLFRRHVFRQLCTHLVTNYGLEQTRNMSIEESVGMFLMTLANGCSNRFVQEFLNHSGEMIHRHFDLVLASMLKVSGDIINLAENYNDDVPKYIINNSRYHPFNDFSGAIDGTHIKASVPKNEEAKYIGRKGYAT